ncbi:MAG: hypothetical protein AB1403_25675 [Candidatus Riflebacteria bacterium]
MNATQKAKNARQWQSHLEVWQAGGLTQAEYCREHKLSEKAFNYWVRKNRQRNSLQLVPLKIQPEVLPTRLIPSRELKLRIGRSACLEIPADFDPAALEKIIRLVADI